LTQTAQGFNTSNTASSGIDERLKAGKWLPIDHMASLVEFNAGNFFVGQTKSVHPGQSREWTLQ
jgi:hypothetical protein